MDTMKLATLFGMPQLLACCEYYIAIHAIREPHAELTARCAAEKLLNRSWARIAHAFSAALQGFTGNRDLGVHCRDAKPCYCCCCVQHRMAHDGVDCGCSAPRFSHWTVARLVPSPKIFLEMATSGPFSQ